MALKKNSEPVEVIFETPSSTPTNHTKRERVSDVTEHWYGEKQDLSEVKQLPLKKFDDITGIDILIVSLQFREETSNDGKPNNYAYAVIITNYDTDKEERNVTFFKGTILLRKLRSIAEIDKLPIVGRVSKVKGKINTYYDIV